jgi:hypothetical protein
MGATRARYRFGPLERRGLIAGWRGGQIATVASGVVLAIALLHRRPAAPTIVAAVVVVAACVAIAWWPVAGRTPEQWLPTVVRWGTKRTLGGHRWRAGVERSGVCRGPDGAACLGDRSQLASPARRAVPTPGERRTRPRNGTFAGLEVLGFVPRDGAGTLGVIYDAHARTFTAVMELLGHSFALLSTDEKERRIASWASVLSSLARERAVVHRVQWLAATLPDDGTAVSRHLAERGVLAADSPARRSYQDLLRHAGGETCKHDVHLAVQLRETAATARAMRALGGGVRAACSLLDREVGSLARQLAGADIPVERVLDERAIAALVRRGLDGGLDGGLGRGCPPCSVAWPWPLAMDAEWGALHADGGWHVTYWIAEWPRLDVGPEFLGPLLLGSVRRTVAVVMEPLSPARAIRQAERARTADVADAELRRRGGFLATARRAREAEVAQRREQEVADGHGSFRFSGYVSVSASSREELIAACESTEEAASQCRLELRRLYGIQEEALGYTLPLARGLA